MFDEFTCPGTLAGKEGGAKRTPALLRLHVLASGSKGNAAVVENRATGEATLIDCGISKKSFFERCGDVGLDPRRISNILVTHEHTDHTKGLGVLLRGLAACGVHPTVLVDDAVRDNSREIRSLLDRHDFRSFQDGDALSLSGMTAHVFATSHDAAASFGFRLETPDDALGYLTDSGYVTPAAHEALSNVRILALESNHEPQLLRACAYPYVVKQRIASDAGHLSNQQAAEELAQLLSNRLEHVVAMHVSENANTYDQPRESLAKALSVHGHEAQASVAYQHRSVSIG